MFVILTEKASIFFYAVRWTKKSNARLYLLTFLALVQSGCTTPQVNEPPPANYRDIIARYVRENFFDPYSIRDASIAAPKIGQLSRSNAIGVEEGWIVCVQANAKNRIGGYIGIKTTAFLIKAGRVVTSHSGDDHYEVRTNCAGVIYEKFNEVESTVEPSSVRSQR